MRSKNYLTDKEIGGEPNNNLIRKQMLDDKQVEKLIEKRNELFSLLYFMNKVPVKLAKKCLPILTELEYELQDIWGFDRDNTYHTWWNRCIHCTCDIAYNDTLRGKEDKQINKNCPLHKHVYKEVEKEYCIHCKNRKYIIGNMTIGSTLLPPCEVPCPVCNNEKEISNE